MLVRHIAGVPTATEQRCVRCCEVIASDDPLAHNPSWPGTVVLRGCRSKKPPEDCKPVDLNTRETLPPMETHLL